MLTQRIKREAGQRQGNVCFRCSPAGGVFTLAVPSTATMETTAYHSTNLIPQYIKTGIKTEALCRNGPPLSELSSQLGKRVS